VCVNDSRVISRLTNSIQSNIHNHITQANNHLVERMMEIMHSNGTVDARLQQEAPAVSLNLRTRVGELRKIEKDNLVIMKRINAAKGSYSKEFPEASISPRPETIANSNNKKPTAPNRPKPNNKNSAFSPQTNNNNNNLKKTSGRRQFPPLFTVGTKLGDIHVRMTIYDKLDGNTCKVIIYDPLSSKQYPIDMDYELVKSIVGTEGADMMHDKHQDAKKMWMYLADQLDLLPSLSEPGLFRLVVKGTADDNDDEYGGEPFEIVQGDFEFADPKVVHEPEKYDAARILQSKFRANSSRKLVQGLRDEKAGKDSPRRRKKKGKKRSPEKLAQEKAELEMLQVSERSGGGVVKDTTTKLNPPNQTLSTYFAPSSLGAGLRGPGCNQ